MSNDHTESLEIAGRLRDTVQYLHDIADKVGEARQVKEFASDRRKNLLAKHMKLVEGANISMGYREMIARQSEDFQAGMKELEEQQLTSERVLAKYEAAKVRADAARSMLSFSKIVMDTLQG
jgi:hypothetical protein